MVNTHTAAVHAELLQRHHAATRRGELRALKRVHGHAAANARCCRSQLTQLRTPRLRRRHLQPVAKMLLITSVTIYSYMLLLANWLLLLRTTQRIVAANSAT